MSASFIDENSFRNFSIALSWQVFTISSSSCNIALFSAKSVIICFTSWNMAACCDAVFSRS